MTDNERGDELDEQLAGRTVTIRQTKNPYVREPQYIVYKKVALDYRGWLSLENLGLGAGSYWLVTRPGRPGPIFGGHDGWLQSWRVKEALEAGEGMVTVVEWGDVGPTLDWWWFVEDYEDRQQSNEYWAGVRKRVWAPIAQWIGGAAPSPTTTTMRVVDYKIPEGASGAEGDNELLEVMTERPNVLHGSGLTHRQRGGALTTD